MIHRLPNLQPRQNPPPPPPPPLPSPLSSRLQLRPSCVGFSAGRQSSSGALTGGFGLCSVGTVVCAAGSTAHHEQRETQTGAPSCGCGVVSAQRTRRLFSSSSLVRQSENSDDRTQEQRQANHLYGRERERERECLLVPSRLLQPRRCSRLRRELVWAPSAVGCCGRPQSQCLELGARLRPEELPFIQTLTQIVG